MAAARVLPLEPALGERRAFIAKQLPVLARCMADLQEQVDHWEQVGRRLRCHLRNVLCRSVELDLAWHSASWGWGSAV